MIMHLSRRAALRINRPVAKYKSGSRNLHVLSREILPPTDAIPFSKEWDFHLVEIDDLTAVCGLIVEGIDSMMNDYGIGGGNSIFNGPYVKLSLRLRSRQRLTNPSIELSSNSFVLAATPRGSSEIAAIVEIMLIKDGEFPHFLPNYFRSLKPDLGHEPYLFNLCVTEVHKKKGLGKLICEIAQELVQMHWKKETMSLHVFKGNLRAQNLYERMGYQLMWTKNAHEIEDEKESVLFYSLRLRRLWPPNPPEKT